MKTARKKTIFIAFYQNFIAKKMRFSMVF